MLLEGTLVLDQKKDTLLYAGTAKVNITDWFFFKDNITLQYIGLDDAIINLNRRDSTWNYQFLVDYFSSPSKKQDTSKNVMQLDLKVVNFKNVTIWQKDEWIGMNMLASVKQLNIDADNIDMENNSIRIKTISLNQPVFSQYDYTGRRPAVIKPVITGDAPEVDITAPKWNSDGWKIIIDNIQLREGMVAIEKEGGKPSEPGKFDERHVILSGINGSLKHFSLVNDSLTGLVNISGKDRGDFEIKKLSTNLKLTPEMIELKDLDLVTERSHLKDYFAMHYRDFGTGMRDFVQAVKLDGNFVNSTLDS